jgi:sugar lactone lactonase YvrE
MRKNELLSAALAVIAAMPLVAAVPAQAESLYVSSFLGGVVDKVNVAQGTFVQFAVVPSGVQEAFDAWGNLYVAETGTGIVVRISPAGVVTTAFSGFTYPSGLARDAAGSFYVADQGSETVTKLDAGGEVLDVISVPHPYSLRFAANGDLYVTQTASSLISRITPEGDVVLFSTAVFQPSYMAFATNGDLYVSSAYYSTITRLTPAGVPSVFVNLGAGGNQLAGLAFADNGDLYASQPETGKILRITPHAQVSTVTSGIVYPNDVVVGVVVPGDLNCDASINFGDINPFVLYLSDFAIWQSTYPQCPAENGDVNGDGSYPSFGDINPFVALLTGGS